jgi:hypothetical protein
VHFRGIWPKVFVSFFARRKRPGEADAKVSIHIMVSGDNEQMSFFQPCGLKKIVEKLSGKLKFIGLSRVGYISCRKN